MIRRWIGLLLFLLHFTLFTFCYEVDVKASELSDIKIEFNNEVFNADTPQSDVENRFFFNQVGEVTLNFTIDLGVLYKERESKASIEPPFTVTTTLNDNKTPINNAIAPINNNGIFTGKYKISILVPAGVDKDFVNIKIKSLENSDWNIINKFDIAFNIIRDISAPNIIVEGVNELGVASDTVSISLYEDYKKSSKFSINLTNPNNEPLTINGEYEGTRIINVPQTVDGECKGTIQATDKAGNKSEKKVSFYTNKVAPSIKFDGEDKTKSYYNSKLIKVDLKDQYGIDLNKSAYKIITPSNEEKEGKFEVSDGNQASTTINLEVEGVYKIEVNAIDLLGQSSKSIGEFTVDRTLPMIDILNIDNLEEGVFGDIGKVDVKVTEKNLALENVIFKIDKVINNAEEQSINEKGNNVPYRTEDGNYIFELGSFLIENSGPEIDVKYNISITATDNAGNETDPKSRNNVKFTIDKNKPKLELRGIENGKHYNLEQVDIIGLITDLNLDTSELIVKKTVKKIGEKPEVITINKSDILTENNGSVVSHSIKVSDEAMYDVVLVASDKAGNKDELKVSFIIDRSKPQVTINNYEELNGIFSSSPKHVSISVLDLNWQGTSVKITALKQKLDGTSETIILPSVMEKENTTFEYDNFIDDGTYTINVLAVDSAGNATEANPLKFTIDKTAPFIKLTGVENDKYYNEDRPVVVKILDFNHSNNIIVVTKDGAPYPVSGFYGEGIEKVFNYTFSKEGRYEIEIVSTDLAGNETKYPKISFVIDKTAPGVKAYFKGENRPINDGEYINRIFTPEFRLDNQEDIIESITLNGEGNYSSAVPSATVESEYNYSVVVADKAGNKTTYGIKFTLDTTNPDVKVDGLLSGFFNEDLKPNFEISDINLVEDSSGATLNGEPYISGTAITEQKEYLLQIKGIDLANNETVRSINFTLDKDKPIIKFVEPISGKYFTEDFIPNFVIDDLSNYTIIAMTLDGKDYQIGDMITEEGKHVLYIEVRDKAGNVESISVEFILDKTPPKFIVTGVENDGQYFNSVIANIKLENNEDKITEINVNGSYAEGEIKDENNKQVAKIRFSQLGKNTLKLKAVDTAGNSVEEIIEFEISENANISALGNKNIIYIGGGVAVIVAIILIIAALYKKKKKSDDK